MTRFNAVNGTLFKKTQNGWTRFRTSIQVAINKVLVSSKTPMIRYYSNKLIELEIKDTTDRSASYLDLHLKFDTEGWLRMKLRQKRWLQFSHCELSIHMGYISLSWYDIPELAVPIRFSLIEGCCHQVSYWTKGSS